MARFEVTTFKGTFTQFKAEPIYIILVSGTKEPIGRPFMSYAEAVNIAQWLNDADEEFYLTQCVNNPGDML